MDLKDYWTKKLASYSTQEWIKHPNIFAKEVVEYFPKQGKLLELASGVGQDSRYFSSLGYDVIATDLIPPSQLVDLNQPLPFPDESFDIVYSHLGLHYFPIKRTVQLFSEIYKTLRPNGLFCTLFNSLTDPEVSLSTRIEDDFYLTPVGINKRFFSVDSLELLLPKEFKILLLDNNGKTIKDGDNKLIRLICQK
jgi:SAM-dependent methyltransferase